MSMRRLLLSLVVGWFAAPLRAELPELLKEAGLKASQGMERWAYTETTVVTDHKGRSKGETIVRVDPSKPYAEQFTPLKINGKAPTEKQLKQYRSKGEQHGRELERRWHATTQGQPSEPPRLTINGTSSVADLDHIAVTEENAGSITYEIPLRSDGKQRLPMEKFQLLVRVSKEQRVLENLSLRLKSPWRTKLIVKINSGVLGVDFTTVDPQFAPEITAIHGDFSASVMFIKVAANVEMTRTDFQRVKPYDEHFNVKVGPLQFLSF